MRSKTLTAFTREIRENGIFQSTCSMRSKTTKNLGKTISKNISIHLLHAEQDALFFSNCLQAITFQSTCSMRSKTGKPQLFKICGHHFNPLAPCGARLQNISNFLEIFIFISTFSLFSANYLPLLPIYVILRSKILVRNTQGIHVHLPFAPA